MNQPSSPAEFVKRNGLFLFAGLLICGVIGYFVAGREGRELEGRELEGRELEGRELEGRELGGGIGAGLGLIVGGLVGKIRKSAPQDDE